ncbi:MAG: hypothetical protein SF069_16260 [Phycisphaerae bacterium]|nr:hypothetical protein [Phycisphaerae bacterium]
MRRFLVGSVLVSLLLASAAPAGVTVTLGDVDTTCTALSGRQGSTTGNIIDDPAPMSTLNGAVSSIAQAVAGPVPPGLLPTTPGTTGVVTVDANASLAFERTGSEFVIDIGSSLTTDIDMMDGGTYLGSAAGGVEVRFTLDTNATYELVGNVAFDDEATSSFLFITGGTLGNLVVRGGPGGNGPIDLAGVMGPGDYRISLVNSIFDVPGTNFGDFNESGSCDLTWVLNPNAPFAAGDMNCDGFITVGDIGGFVLALTDPAGYSSAFPSCDIDLADVNHDGFVTVGDISAFVALLVG